MILGDGSKRYQQIVMILLDARATPVSLTAKVSRRYSMPSGAASARWHASCGTPS